MYILNVRLSLIYLRIKSKFSFKVLRSNINIIPAIINKKYLTYVNKKDPLRGDAWF